MMRIITLVLSITVIFASALCAAAQTERYELGKRLQRFEQSWQSATEERRADSTSAVNNAVRSFFSAQLTNAAKELDEAWLTVRNSTATPFERNAIAWSCRLVPYAIDSSRSNVAVTVKAFYETLPLPDDAVIEWSLISPMDNKVVATASKPISELADSEWNLVLPQIEPGDYRLQSRLMSGAEIVPLADSSFSSIEKLDKRLENLKATTKTLRGKIDASLFYTAKDLVDIVEKLNTTFDAEVDFPANQLLEFSELIVENPSQAAKSISDQARNESIWMTLAQKRKQVPIRIQAPPNSTKKLPVLFLLHGAGGSENMFFETCGAGRCVQLGLDRGWLVVAPRQKLGRLVLNCSEMLDELEKFFDVDREHVFLVGHSMGGAQVVRQVEQQPELVRGAVVLGGGGQARDYFALTKTPWYIAAGEYDFGRRGALALHKNLKSVEANVTYQGFDDVEHMVIVQAATDSFFAFLDGLNGNLRESNK